MESIEIESKANGIVIEIAMDTLPDLANITGWQANSGWFYITLYRVSGDSASLMPTNLAQDILDFQIIETKESLQLGIRLNETIENHEFSQGKNTNTLVASLHYSTEYLAQLDTIKQMELGQTKRRLSSEFKNWLYFTGTGLGITGLLNNSNNDVNTQTTIGIGILISTFILDKI
jgi:hypothetical protein